MKEALVKKNIAQQYFNQQRKFEEAEKVLQEALKLWPGNPDIIKLLNKIKLFIWIGG